MVNQLYGYHGALLEVNLTTGKTEKISLNRDDIRHFLGGRGLGIKLLWDRLGEAGVDPLSPENPLLFLAGPFSGLPIPSASRVVVVTKSPCTSPKNSLYPKASSISYSNMGGFFGPEIKFAGYDGIIVTGSSPTPVYIKIEDDTVQIRDAKKYWGMRTDDFDKLFLEDLNDKRFRTCYIGPAGEKLVSYACILHTAARAAGRGVGCVMGSKNLKAIAIKGSKMTEVANHAGFLEELEKSRNMFKEQVGGRLLKTFWKSGGTANLLGMSNARATMAVKNYQEGTYKDLKKIGLTASKKKAWVRNMACFCCHLSCKKCGIISKNNKPVLVHDGPEYETGTIFGANLMVSDFKGLMKSIYMGDDYGMDIISTGNVLGFLMEAYEKNYIDRSFLDGIDLKWGNVSAIHEMIVKIANREGVGNIASKGVKRLSEIIGKDSNHFAMHVKGLEISAWNPRSDHKVALSYATTNRGACHMSGENPISSDVSAYQDFIAVSDSIGLCMFASNHGLLNLVPGINKDMIVDFLSTITGEEWSEKSAMQAGERIFNLEKMFNYREGFRREDDYLPERVFLSPAFKEGIVGRIKTGVVDREIFNKDLDKYYRKRGWDKTSSKPDSKKLETLKLSSIVA